MFHDGYKHIISSFMIKIIHHWNTMKKLYQTPLLDRLTFHHEVFIQKKETHLSLGLKKIYCSKFSLEDNVNRQMVKCANKILWSEKACFKFASKVVFPFLNPFQKHFLILSKQEFSSF